MVCGGGLLGIVYFAVGSRSMQKAGRSALSARRNGAMDIETMLVTDERGMRLARNGSHNSFDRVYALSSSGPPHQEFEATRAVSSGGHSGSLRKLRASKIDAMRLALGAYDIVVFLDADTYVCSSLSPIACALDHDAIAAFVAVPEGREHGTALLKHVPAKAREANTGVLAIRNGTRALALVDEWRRQYHDINFFMDQPAFRAALHSTQTPYALLPPTFNCRGHRRRPPNAPRDYVTAIPLRCHGFDTLQDDSLRGGRGCAILHSHDIRHDSDVVLGR